MWHFSLSMEGFLINGFTYVRKDTNNPAIMAPLGHKAQRVVVAFGVHWKRLAERVAEQVRDLTNAAERGRLASLDEGREDGWEETPWCGVHP